MVNHQVQQTLIECLNFRKEALRITLNLDYR